MKYTASAIQAHRDLLAQLRAQRKFRDYTRKVANISAWRPNPLLSRSVGEVLEQRAAVVAPRRFAEMPVQPSAFGVLA